MAAFANNRTRISTMRENISEQSAVTWRSWCGCMRYFMRSAHKAGCIHQYICNYVLPSTTLTIDHPRSWACSNYVGIGSARQPDTLRIIRINDHVHCRILTVCSIVTRDGKN